MTTSEWLSVIALIIATGGFAINLRNWFMSGPKLHLSLMADAMSIPDEGRGPHLVLIVINRGTTPTVLTHMVVYSFPSWWARRRLRSKFAAIVNSDRIPYELDINRTWMGFMVYNDEANRLRTKGQLYVGVISSHTSKNFLIKVPPKTETKVPTKEITADKQS